MKLSDAAILIVDDEPALVEIFEEWITDAGCRNVHTAANGEAALAVLKAHKIHLLISDIRMPVMDGISLVRHLGEMGETLPSVIFVSGFGTLDQREMYGLGVEAFFSKPMDRGELVAAVENALKERDLLWVAPMEGTPKQTIILGDSPDAKGVETLLPGRGGFSASCSEPVHIGRVAFRAKCPGKESDFAGEGFVRWQDRATGRIGIEFYFLEPSCRSRVIEEIVSSNPRSFIPDN